MKVYLTSFYPLCSTAKGRAALKQFPQLKPYIDGSCRREPDFEHKKPAITGLCRPGFSKKLNVGDVVIYVTNVKGVGARKLVAILKVINKQPDHRTAAQWYQQQGLSLPNNLMVQGNKPFPINQTHQIMGWNQWVGNVTTLQQWNQGYQQRASSHLDVAICKHLVRPFLKNPSTLTDRLQNVLFGRSAGTQNPSIFGKKELDDVKDWLRNNVVV